MSRQDTVVDQQLQHPTKKECSSDGLWCHEKSLKILPLSEPGLIQQHPFFLSKAELIWARNNYFPLI
jgi:hypothetical protein